MDQVDQYQLRHFNRSTAANYFYPIAQPDGKREQSLRDDLQKTIRRIWAGVGQRMAAAELKGRGLMCGGCMFVNGNRFARKKGQAHVHGLLD